MILVKCASKIAAILLLWYTLYDGLQKFPQGFARLSLTKTLHSTTFSVLVTLSLTKERALARIIHLILLPVLLLMCLFKYMENSQMDTMTRYYGVLKKLEPRNYKDWRDQSMGV